MNDSTLYLFYQLLEGLHDGSRNPTPDEISKISERIKEYHTSALHFGCFLKKLIYASEQIFEEIKPELLQEMQRLKRVGDMRIMGCTTQIRSKKGTADYSHIPEIQELQTQIKELQERVQHIKDCALNQEPVEFAGYEGYVPAPPNITSDSQIPVIIIPKYD